MFKYSDLDPDLTLYVDRHILSDKGWLDVLIKAYRETTDSGGFVRVKTDSPATYDAFMLAVGTQS
jgi:hypothetical protein